MYFYSYYLVDRMFSKSSTFVGYPFGKEHKQRYLMMKWILDGWCLGEHQARGVLFAPVPSISSFIEGAIGYEVQKLRLIENVYMRPARLMSRRCVVWFLNWLKLKNFIDSNTNNY